MCPEKSQEKDKPCYFYHWAFFFVLGAALVYFFISYISASLSIISCRYYGFIHNATSKNKKKEVPETENK